jgi:hypothetical protein
LGQEVLARVALSGGDLRLQCTLELVKLELDLLQRAALRPLSH